MRRLQVLSLVVVVTLVAKPVQSGAFFVSPTIQTDSPGAVAHPIGYDGTGGPITVSVCIDPASPSAAELAAPAARAIDTLNALVPTTGTYVPIGESTQVPAGHFDAESVLLHEIAHCVGIHHGNKPPNMTRAQELAFSDATMSNTGPDNLYSFILIGADNIWGSSDDLRGDDGNLFWFRKMNNDPFSLPGGPPLAYDQSNYTRDLADLPVGAKYAANGTPAVAESLGYSDTKAVMYAQTGVQSEFRSLSHDDVTMLRYASSGLNEIAGDADDYVLTLELIDFPCDIPIKLEPLGLASDTVGRCRSVNQTQGPIAGSTDHYTLDPIAVELNADFSWFFGSALDLAVTKTDGDVEVLPGGDIVYMLEVSNVGDDIDATGVEIEETVPDSTTFNAASSDPGWNCTDIVAGSECLLSVGTLTAGGSPVQATFVVTVDNPVPGGVKEIFNLARVSDDGNNGPDPNPGNDLAQESTPIDSGLVFSDGFESGNTSAWSGTSP
ncbi:MAG: DUF11 domain-containing protein [Thermoanaerobaculia bacterium]|nr:DUF11 domain-containing protein [Thermoanaerobaculia bacterium]